MLFLKSVFFPFNIKNIKEILLGPYSPRSRTIFMEEIKKKCYLLYLLPGNIKKTYQRGTKLFGISRDTNTEELKLRKNAAGASSTANFIDKSISIE